MRDPGGGKAYSSKSNFEAQSHARLKAMVDGADPRTVMRVGDDLSHASTVIQQIADDLFGHMRKLQWEGEAGDAFRDWGTKVASATEELAAYTSTAGAFVTNAGSTLSDVQKALPDVPEQDLALVRKYQMQPCVPTGTPVDADRVSSASAQAAQTRIDSAHQQAIAQMEKLGQSYEMSTDVMSTASVPTYPPTPTALMPPRPQDVSSSVSVPVESAGSSGTPGGSPTTGGYGPTSQNGTGSSGFDPGQVGGTARTTGPGAVGGSGGNVSTRIDSAAVVPAPTVSSGASGSGSQAVGGPSASGGTFLPGMPGGAAAEAFGGAGVLRSGGRLPGGMAGEEPVAAGKAGSGGLGRSRVPRYGAVVGEGESTLPGGLAGGRARLGGAPGASAEAEGVSGGSRTTGQGGVTGRGGFSGRGQVIGEGEESRGFMGGGMAGGAGVGGRTGHVPAGRRLATEEGGVVGQRQGPGVGGEFTKGGSGLRTRGTEGAGATGDDRSGMVPGGVQTGAGRRAGRRGQRADYLVEEEETWLSEVPESNPTVIE